MIKQKIKAFTLVELIVVITILAILGTIAFISLQGFSSDARDSTRISDTSTMKKSLELYYVSESEYPDPDDSASVNYDTETLWNQGSFGEDVISGVWKNLSEAPLDPLTGEQYTYSLSNTKTEYEILELLESDDLVMNNILVPTVNAADTKVYSKITGNYNGVYLETENYVVPVPSIINAEVTDIDLELDNDNIKSMIVSGEDNVLKVGDVVEETGALDIKLSVYDGNITQNNTDEEKEEIITAIQSAYSGSDVENNSNISAFVSVEDEDKIDLFDSAISGKSSSTLSVSNNPVVSTGNSCSPVADYNYNETGRLYNFDSIIHNETGTSTISENENNGIFDYTLSIQCDDGLYISETETGPIVVSCNEGYIKDGLTCRRPVSCNEIHNDNLSLYSGNYTIYPQDETGVDVYCDMTSGGVETCESTTLDGYNLSDNLVYGDFQILNKSSNLSEGNGTYDYTATLTCTDGILIKSSESTSINCNDGYVATVDSCEKSSLMTGIIGYWDFDEGSGSVTKDKLGNGNNLNVYTTSDNEGSWEDGVIGSSYNIDGNGWIYTKTSELGNANTVSFWFKLNDNSDRIGTFVSFADSSDGTTQDNLGQDNLTYGTLTCKENQLNYGYSVNDDDWHFYSISKGTDTIICLDGNCENTGIDSSDSISSPDSFNLNGGIGCGFSNFEQGFQLDELRIYSSTFSKDKLEEIYTDSAGVTPTLSEYNGAYRYNNGTYASSCEEYYNSLSYNGEGDGEYWIKYNSNDEIQVSCDMVNGGYTAVLNWNREFGDDNVSTLSSLMTTNFNNMTEFTDISSTNIRWSDYDATGDVLDMELPINLENSGDVILDLHYYGYSMDDAGTWFYVTDENNLEYNLVCGDNNTIVGSYYSEDEILYKPNYTCPYTTSGNWDWNTNYTLNTGNQLKSFNLTSLNIDIDGGDYSDLYKMILWIK